MTSTPRQNNPTSPNSEAKSAGDTDAAKAVREGWREDADKLAGVHHEELEALRRQAPPADVDESAIWFDMAEERRLRMIGIPANADPVDVMTYLEELGAKLEAERDQQDGGESDLLAGKD